MFSFYKKLKEWNNLNIIQEQRYLDKKLSSLECSKTVSLYLLYLREHGRQQKEKLHNISLFKYIDTVDEMNKDNENIIQDLKNLTESLNPCKSLEEWIISRD
jgi:hypothetical protein